jgi:hypothetical protein
MASLLELLLTHKVISTDQAREAATLAEETGAFVGRILVAQGAVEEDRLAEFLVSHCTVQPSKDDLKIESGLANLLPERLMRRYRVVPLKQDTRGVLSLAVTDPLSIGGLDQVKRRLGFPMRLVLVNSGTVERLLASTAYDDKEVRLSHVQSPAVASVPSVRLPESPAVVAGDIELDETAGEAPLVAEKTQVAADVGGGARMDELDDRDSGRSARDRVPYQASWKPHPVANDLSNTLLTALETLMSIVEGSEQRYAVVAGPDVARDLVLRKLFTTAPMYEGRYVDLFAHRYPEDDSLEFPPSLIIDGLDAVSLENEEEQRAMLRDISRAFSSRIPFVAGVRTPPAESKLLPSGLKLTLGLGRLVEIDSENTSDQREKADRLFQSLVDETIRWSEDAFPGAGLQSLMGEVKYDYEGGNRREAIVKGCAAVAGRISRLIEE